MEIPKNIQNHPPLMMLKTLKLFHFARAFICLFDASRKKLQMVVCLMVMNPHGAIRKKHLLPKHKYQPNGSVTGCQFTIP